MATEEEQRLMKRFQELSRRSDLQSLYTFTDFLGLGEQTLFYQASSGFSPAKHTFFGGHPSCERGIFRFGDPKELGYEEEFPICCLKISPTAPKFAEHLTHRDYLGALVNLGIERSTLGDILVKEKEAYLFCLDTIAPFICDTLERVRRTPVVCKPVSEVPEDALPKLEDKTINIASERLDVLIAGVFHLSRNQCLELFPKGRIFVDGRLCENNGMKLSPGTLISVRGFGRFFYEGILSETKKGRLMARVRCYSS